MVKLASPSSRSESTGWAYWSAAPSELFLKLESGLEGLSLREAKKRLLRFGPNGVQPAIDLKWFVLLLRQYRNPLVLVLVIAAVVAMILRDWTEATIILVIIFGSTLLGFAQEYRADRSMMALRRRLALKATVRRNGQVAAIPVDAIVPGDIVLLSAGNLVPADGVLLEAKDFMIVEAALTGESLPVEKRPGTSPPDSGFTERKNCVFFGTSVRSGTATMIVTCTGRSTSFGAIARVMQKRPPETAFMAGIRRFGYMLLQVVVLLGLFALIINLLLHRPFTETLLFSLALMVGVSPELLPAVVSVTLSAGARSMARHGVVVRKLEAIENLGSMDVLCVDKTGTITKGEMEFREWTDPSGMSSSRVRELAYINSFLESGIENPLDAAIVSACARDLSIEPSRKIDEIPYDFLRKRLTIVINDPETQRHLIICKGAFENILEVCSRFRAGDGEATLSAEARTRIADLFQARGEQGFRVLGIASKSAVPQGRYTRDDERDMTFEGFLLFADPIKLGAKDMIGRLREAGVALKIITGDNRYVSTHIAREVGLSVDSVLTGKEIAAMSDEALGHHVRATSLFVEADPQSKERIVRLLRGSGSSVGYLGDGINDAPALHAADVGISVDQAVDVARESADIVLLKPDLSAIYDGMRDGRTAFRNTQKYLHITTSANFGNMVSMALIAPLLPFLPMLAPQILLNNLLSDIPLLAITDDNVSEEVRSQPQHWNLAELRGFMVIFGLISTVFDLLAFAVIMKVFHVEPDTFRTAWFVLSLLTELLVILVLRTRAPFYRSAPSPLLFALIMTGCAIAVAIPWLPYSSVFAFTPISPALLVTIGGIVFAYLAATEVTKTFYFRFSRAQR